MKRLLIYILLFTSQNLFSQVEQEALRIIEYYPLCLNCKETVEEFINERINNFSLNPSDTSIIVNYQLTAQGTVENVHVYGTDNQDFIEVIIEATENITEWIPALLRNQPVRINLQYKIIPDYTSGKLSFRTLYIHNANLDSFLKERNSRYWETYFEENSIEVISHLDIWKLQSYIMRRLNYGYHRRLTKSPYFKTGSIRFQTTGEKTTWSIFVPKRKICGCGVSQNNKNLQIKNIPIDHEIILIVIKENHNRITFSFNEFNYSGQKKLNLNFNEYSYLELNKQIESIIDK